MSYLIDDLNKKVYDVLKNEFIDIKFTVHHIGNKCSLYVKFNDLPICLINNKNIEKTRIYLTELINDNEKLIKVLHQSFKYYLELNFKNPEKLKQGMLKTVIK